MVEQSAKTFSIEERLAKVQSLLDKGAISGAEYQEQRKKILDQF